MKSSYSNTANEFSELDWTAFRYLANELTSDEIEQFEQLLAHDLAAQTALAQMVELTQLTARACRKSNLNSTIEQRASLATNASRQSLPNSSKSKKSFLPSRWLAVAASIALVFGAVYGLLSWSHDTGEQQIALVWFDQWLEDGVDLADETMGWEFMNADSLTLEFARLDLDDGTNVLIAEHDQDDEHWVLSAAMSLDDLEKILAN